MIHINRILVIGGGPAGLFCAGIAARAGADVTVAEKNSSTGKKLLITGKGRCNVTNNCDTDTLIKNTPVNGRFMYGAFSRFSCADTMYFFESHGVPLKTERGARVFPVSDRASDILSALTKFCEESGVKIKKNCTIRNITKNEYGKFNADLDGGSISADKVIIATGGMSYPVTGSDGDGYRFARDLGHTVVTPKASLVPLVSPDRCCRDMMGLSLRNVGLRIMNGSSSKPVYEDFGELLFTHFGLSGPIALSASSHIREISGTSCFASIDLKPALSHEKLDERILRDFSENINRDFGNSLSKLLPSKMIPTIVSRSGIPFTQKVNSVTRAQRSSLVSIIKNFTVALSGFRPIDEAIITSGGVSVKEINPKTMESKITKGLYFAGEVIDVDAHTGGFNLQIAWSSAYCAGTSAADSEV